jgi:hypothetical protein
MLLGANPSPLFRRRCHSTKPLQIDGGEPDPSLWAASRSRKVAEHGVPHEVIGRFTGNQNRRWCSSSRE